MALKIEKSTIHRLNASISCGCFVSAEFSDAQCKESKGDVEFTPCEAHLGKAGIDMVELILRERLDEAIEEAKKTPAAVYRHNYAPPEIEDGDTGGVIATGGNVQSVMKVVKPIAVRERSQNPPGIKTIQRSTDQLAKVGAAPTHVQGGAVDMQIEEATEDTRYTPHIEEALDFLDPQESGLLDNVGEAV